MKNPFGKNVYGQVGVNIDELAGQIAQQMVEAGERSKQAQREANLKYQYTQQEEIYVIARRTAYGYSLESVESVGILGVLSSIGQTLDIAKANFRYLLKQKLLARKAARNEKEAQERVAAVKLYVADVLGEQPKIQVGAGD